MQTGKRASDRPVRTQIDRRIFTKRIFDSVSAQRCSLLFRRKNFKTTFNNGKVKRRPIDWAAWKFCRRAIAQLIAGPTAPNTLETFVPTERIDAIAATAINEAISVYSTTVAP